MSGTKRVDAILALIDRTLAAVEENCAETFGNELTERKPSAILRPCPQ